MVLKSHLKFIFIIGHPGGATPGKFLMGLRIYTCDQVKYISGDTASKAHDSIIHIIKLQKEYILL